MRKLRGQDTGEHNRLKTNFKGYLSQALAHFISPYELTDCFFTTLHNVTISHLSLSYLILSTFEHSVLLLCMIYSLFNFSKKALKLIYKEIMRYGRIVLLPKA